VISKLAARVLILLFFSHALAGSALANDGVAHIGLGGLELAKSDHIRIVKEDLFISLDEITVHYVFENLSEEDITETVMFPIPDIEFDELTTYRPPLPDSTNFVAFKATAAGKVIVPQVQARAFAGFGTSGMEVTGLFAQEGRPIVRFPNSKHALENWPSALPSYWTARIVFYWQQTFPAKQQIEVEHSYKPVIGDIPSTYFDGKGGYSEAVCVTEESSFPWYIYPWAYPSGHAKRVSYILKTARSWSGPIGSFKLTLRMPNSFAEPLTCFKGLQRINATDFEFAAENYVPDLDLHVAILGAR
jgi:hypothetical protein